METSYQPWISEDRCTLAQIFTNEQGLIVAVQMAYRSDPFATWEPPTHLVEAD